jgi:uncharacterized protein YciI
MSRRLAAASLAGLVVFAAAAVAFARPQQHPAVDVPPRWFVELEIGKKFETGKLLRDQPGFMDHVMAIRKMTSDGALLLGGPLLESFESHTPTGEIMIVQAADAAAARKVVESDPFVAGEVMKIGSVRAFFAGAGSWIPAAKPTEPAPGKGDGGH